MRLFFVLAALVAITTEITVTKGKIRVCIASCNVLCNFLAPLYGDEKNSIKDEYMVVFQKELTDEQSKLKL